MKNDEGCFYLIVCILVCLYFAWDVILILLMVGMAGFAVYSIYKSKLKHKLYWMYQLSAISLILIIVLATPILHVRIFKNQVSWLDNFYGYLWYRSNYQQISEDHVKHIVEAGLGKNIDKGEHYELFNRIASEETGHYYLDFDSTLTPYTFFRATRKDNEFKYYDRRFLKELEFTPNSYSWSERLSVTNKDFFELYQQKYELADNTEFFVRGLFDNNRLYGVVFDCCNTDNHDDCLLSAQVISKNIEKKFGKPHERKRAPDSYIAKWLFSDKHIIIECNKYVSEERVDWGKEDFVFSVYIYTPRFIYMQTAEFEKDAELKRQKQETEERKRKEAEYKLKQDEIKAKEAVRKQQELDSISEHEEKERIQNGF